MKRKFSVFIGLDSDGDWPICATVLRYRGQHGRILATGQNTEVGYLCGKVVRRVLGVPPCKVGEQVKVTFLVEKIKKIKGGGS